MTASNPQPAGGSGVDPSMEDILASIRRILSEDEGGASPPAQDEHVTPAADVLALDPSMLVEEPPPVSVQATKPVETQPSAASAPRPAPPLSPAVPVPPLPEPMAAKPMRDDPLPPAPVEEPAPTSPPDSEPLLGEVASAAAVSSVGSLLRTLASERQNVAVYRGGPTLEDLAREEMRPLLKQWLDSNLPAMVERLVRAEIERVVGRAVS